MYINKLIIHNFKGFKHFEMDFSDNVNVIVGNNNEGKTTIFEAIHLALTASINGKMHLRISLLTYSTKAQLTNI